MITSSFEGVNDHVEPEEGGILKRIQNELCEYALACSKTCGGVTRA